jgi:hypothetical protein
MNLLWSAANGEIARTVESSSTNIRKLITLNKRRREKIKHILRPRRFSRTSYSFRDT